MLRQQVHLVCLLTTNVKQGQGHVMLQEEQWVPEEIEDKLQGPEAERAPLCCPATMCPDLPPCHQSLKSVLCLL